ncbi:hypothetical protein [Kurthia senegalensis]|uniref:hypothetical protein n=1 Tax=Kurthia senegalensis TaxID=1033740 RepID=UPI0002887A3C|nr:hypothetical protein [Kurthia senegalensis]
MNIFELLAQVQAITGGKFGLSDLLSEEFVEEHTKFSSIPELMKALPIDLSDLSTLQNYSESDLNEFVKEHSSYDSWKALLQAAVTFIQK